MKYLIVFILCMLAIGTLGLSSVVKGVVKSLEKAGKDLDK